jgi:hypothetical protein
MVVSFIASLSIYFGQKDHNNILRFFPPFLLSTIVVELTGTYLLSNNRPNVSLYNFFTAFEFCFYLFFVSTIIANSKIRLLLRYIIIIYAAFAVINIFFVQGMKSFHTVSYAFGCLLVVAACIYYFFELFKYPKSLKLTGSPTFWICSGLLFFYCCGFPLYGMFNYLNGISKLIIQNFHNIVVILNIFLYSLFTIAFLCRLKVRKYTLSPS